MRWNGWDGMGLDGMGWDGVGWGGVVLISLTTERHARWQYRVDPLDCGNAPRINERTRTAHVLGMETRGPEVEWVGARAWKVM